MDRKKIAELNIANEELIDLELKRNVLKSIDSEFKFGGGLMLHNSNGHLEIGRNDLCEQIIKLIEESLDVRIAYLKKFIEEL